MSEVVTYPEMDSAIVDLLRIRDDDPICGYAAARIVALEAEVRALRERAERAEVDLAAAQKREPSRARLGGDAWICPRCGSVQAWWVPRCDCPPPIATKSTG